MEKKTQYWLHLCVLLICEPCSTDIFLGVVKVTGARRPKIADIEQEEFWIDECTLTGRLCMRLSKLHRRQNL